MRMLPNLPDTPVQLLTFLTKTPLFGLSKHLLVSYTPILSFPKLSVSRRNPAAFLFGPTT